MNWKKPVAILIAIVVIICIVVIPVIVHSSTNESTEDKCTDLCNYRIAYWTTGKDHASSSCSPKVTISFEGENNDPIVFRGLTITDSPEQLTYSPYVQRNNLQKISNVEMEASCSDGWMGHIELDVPNDERNHFCYYKEFDEYHVDGLNDDGMNTWDSANGIIGEGVLVLDCPVPLTFIESITSKLHEE